MVFDSSDFYYTPPVQSEATVAMENPYDDWTDDDITELFDERAAVMEFDGGLSRADADSMALEIIRNEVGDDRFAKWEANCRK